MILMILPEGYVLDDPSPAPAGWRIFSDRLAVYWKLTNGKTKSVEFRWGLRKGDVGESLRLSQPRSPFPFDVDKVPEFATFLSYRRDDHWAVGRINDRLIHLLGARAVFRDIHSIKLGTDFRKAIDDAVGQCKVMLVVIGPSWLERSKPKGKRRIDTKKDWVRIEIESALQLHKKVVPFLLDEAQMPDRVALPPSVRELAFYQACILRESKFDEDVSRLIDMLREYIK
jgi:hypothetical protein